MTPREWLYREARRELRACRRKRDWGRLNPEPWRGQYETEALYHLGQANALRAFAQRQLPECGACNGNGHGYAARTVGRMQVSGAVPRGCRECLGGGVRLALPARHDPPT